jgi:amino acid adenylation domain-containing protein
MTVENESASRKLADRLGDLSPEKRAALEKLLKKKGVSGSSPSPGSADSAPPLVPVSHDQDLPLSFDQQRMWILYQLEPDSIAYNLHMTTVFQAPVETLMRALNTMVERHEILRTTYNMGASGPVQNVHPASSADVQIIDLSGLTDEEAGKEAIRIAPQGRKLSFDLENGPVWRALLLKFSNGRTGLNIAIHHIATDGWSIQRLFQELRELCRAYDEGDDAKLPPLPIQYADYAIWQRQWLQGDALQSLLSYWRKRLEGMNSALELSTDFSRPTTQTYNGAAVLVGIEDSLAVALKDLARHEQATLFMVMLAIFKILLYRYTGQADLVVGTPIAGRERPEVENVQGLFLNTLVLRTELPVDESFIRTLGDVRKTTLGAFSNQYLPFEKLVEDLQPQRDPGRNPLFQAFFTKPIAHETSRQHHRKNLIDDVQALPEGQAEFDLALWVDEYTDGFDLRFHFNTDLFRVSTIERLAGHFLRLAKAVVEDPGQSISLLPILTQAERSQQLYEWNQTQTNNPYQSVSRQIEQQAARTPEAIALEFNGRCMSYAALNARANQLAHYLQKLGVGPETMVGVSLERSTDMVIGILAILKAGGAYVPLDPYYPADRLSFMLQDSQASVLLSDEHLLSGLPENIPPVVCMQRDRDAIDSQVDGNLVTAPAEEDPAYVIYTSGSTGTPKGVQIPHRALANFLYSMAIEPGFSQHDALVAVTTLSFDIAALELFLPLTSGARLILASRETAADGMALAELISTSDATVMQATPATWRMLLSAGWHGKTDMKVLCGGEALPSELARELLPYCAELWNLYGPTETTIWSTVHRVTAVDGPIPIGRPIANTTTYILDPYMQPVATGCAGELYIGGTGVARGYWQRPELNVERFVADPFNENHVALMYRTGDRVRYLPDGVIEYLGRLDNQVKLRGFRIELGEIEAVLDRHEGVRASVATVREDTPGDQRLVAYFVSQQEPVPSMEELRSLVASSLPHYMVPNTIMSLDSLPLTPSGKVDRKALPAPELSQLTHTRYIAPQTDYECALAEVWCEVLGVEQVSISDNFFDIGGHSLLAIQSIVKFRQKVGKELDPMNYYQQTLGQLAASVDDAKVSRKASAQLSTDCVEPLFFGSDERQLYGLFRPADSPRNIGVILCQPHAHEYIRCHRTFREIANRLSIQ